MFAASASHDYLLLSVKELEDVLLEVCRVTWPYVYAEDSIKLVHFLELLFPLYSSAAAQSSLSYLIMCQPHTAKLCTKKFIFLTRVLIEPTFEIELRKLRQTSESLHYGDGPIYIKSYKSRGKLL